MAYTSDIDLKLAETPKTTNPAEFPDMVDIYNALHILGQWVDRLKKGMDGSGSGGSELKPWEAMQFTRWFYVPAARAITKSSIITVIYSEWFTDDDWGNTRYTIDGAVNGCGITHLPFYRDGSKLFVGVRVRSTMTGFAMTDAAEGELVKVGVGPAIINMPGIKAGQIMHARPAADHTKYNDSLRLINDGTLYKLPDDPKLTVLGTFVPIGYGVADDALMIDPIFSPAYVVFPPDVEAPDSGAGD